jgi:hypothetical protein
VELELELEAVLLGTNTSSQVELEGVFVLLSAVLEGVLLSAVLTGVSSRSRVAAAAAATTAGSESDFQYALLLAIFSICVAASSFMNPDHALYSGNTIKSINPTWLLGMSIKIDMLLIDMLIKTNKKINKHKKNGGFELCKENINQKSFYLSPHDS